MKIHSAGSQLFHTDGQTGTDRYNAANSGFSESAKAPKETKVRCHLCENLTSNKKCSSEFVGSLAPCFQYFTLPKGTVPTEEIWPYSAE
jgi:hypothetical protein